MFSANVSDIPEGSSVFYPFCSLLFYHSHENYTFHSCQNEEITSYHKKILKILDTSPWSWYHLIRPGSCSASATSWLA